MSDITKYLHPSLTVGILTANRDKLLKPLLCELLKQIQPSDEILVLDTVESPDTKKLLSDFHSDSLVYVSCQIKPFNFATARNLILSEARNQAIVFIDDDAFPFPGWVDRVRSNLAHHKAVGGPTVANGPLPPWWHPGINWCAGLSPPGAILGMPGFYPDTCNLGACSSVWQQHPFPVVQNNDNQIYLTGREDADWWQSRRIAGDDIIIDFRQAVSHAVHTDRLTLPYVKNRAKLDGQASWLRKPDHEKATSIPWDLAHIAGVVADKYLRSPNATRSRLPDTIWMHRQWGLFKAVWQSPPNVRPSKFHMFWQLMRAMKFQIQIRVGKSLFKLRNRTRHTNNFPTATPTLIFVSADCHVGDTVLLRRHIQVLATSFPKCEIVVSARHPSLLTGLEANAVILSPADAHQRIKSSHQELSAAIVPYYPFGNPHLWRTHLSPVGATFNCDVGFSGRRDTIYARRVIEKNLELHEHENLARLFRLWPLATAPLPAAASIPDSDQRWIDDLIESQLNGQPYIVVQFGGGYPAKEWPLDCWIPFLQQFSIHANRPLVIIGGDNWRQAAEQAVSNLSINPPIVNLVGVTTLQQMMALINNAEFFVGGCSGPKHIAMMYRVPTFTLYTATEPHRWGASENHELHAYVSALPQKLTAMELQGLPEDHRSRLLDSNTTAQAAIRHYKAVTRQD